jgi:hypothetical protein
MQVQYLQVSEDQPQAVLHIQIKKKKYKDMFIGPADNNRWNSRTYILGFKLTWHELKKNPVKIVKEPKLTFLWHQLITGFKN